MQKENSKTINLGKINIILHAGFIALAAYYFLINKDVSSATANLGISLVFDPFRQDQPWKERPVFQKIWLIVLVALTMTGFVSIFI